VTADAIPVSNDTGLIFRSSPLHRALQLEHGPVDAVSWQPARLLTSSSTIF